MTCWMLTSLWNPLRMQRPGGDKTFFLYMDNFFTPLPFFRRLKEKGHDAIGIIRASRIEKAPLKTIESMKNLARGASNQLTDTDSWITLVRYQYCDCCIYKHRGTEPIGQARCWSGALKQKISACIIMSGVSEYLTLQNQHSQWEMVLASYCFFTKRHNEQCMAAVSSNTKMVWISWPSLEALSKHISWCIVFWD